MVMAQLQHTGRDVSFICYAHLVQMYCISCPDVHYKANSYGHFPICAFINTIRGSGSNSMKEDSENNSYLQN